MTEQKANDARPGRRRSRKPTPKVSLVTGACGFIGSHVVEQLAREGHRIIAADHPSAWEGRDDPVAGRYPDLVRKLATETVAIDLGDPSTFVALPKGVDTVYHVAAIFNYTAPYSELVRINVEGGRALLDYYADSRRLKRWVQWGAGGVYGMPSDRGVREFTEDLAPLPNNNYLQSKWEQEFMVMSHAPTLGIDYTIIRPTTVYGPRAAYGSNQMFQSALDMPVIAMPANLNTHIPWSHVVDVARAAIHLAGHKGAANQIYNVNDDTVMTALEFFQAMARLLGKPFIKLPPVPLAAIIKLAGPLLEAQFKLFRDVLKKQPPVEPDVVRLSTEDFRYSNTKLKETGFRFTYPDARMAFPETVAWYQQLAQN